MPPHPISGKAEAFLRWAGSKRQLIADLKNCCPTIEGRYVEPFAGSARLFFELAPKKAILGDINSELVRALRTVRRCPREVARKLSPLRRSKRLYLRLRALDPSTLSSAERAARFIYLNRYCFNGLYRTNLAGKFNVPFGAQATGSLPTEAQLSICARLLRRSVLVNGDFEQVLSMTVREDFVYMDPPYAQAGTRTFTEYDARAFSTKDLDRVRSWMIRLNEQGTRFVVSYAEGSEAEVLRRGFRFRSVEVRRNIAGFSNRRKRLNEVLIWNF